MGMLAACALITLVGALDDRFDLHPPTKLLGQIAAAVIAVASACGPGRSRCRSPACSSSRTPAPRVTVIGLVGMMNVVNFSDGVDGLAAGVCAIIAAAFAVIAFDLDRPQPACSPR